MPVESSKPLVIGISSRALLNLEKEDAVYRELGPQGFIDYQREHQEKLIPKGVAFPLVKSLLELNKHFDQQAPPAVKVVIISGIILIAAFESFGLWEPTESKSPKPRSPVESP